MKQNKMPYRVPTMDEIRALPWNGFTAASTFSGCGGSSLGYRLAGYRVLYASEFIDAARETYQTNAPTTIVDGRDIRAVQAEDVLDLLKMKPGELDLLDGSPPCASFSTAGNREDDWGKVKKYSDKSQRTDDLFGEYIRLVRGIRPKVFVAENVSGLVKGTAKGYFIEILNDLRACGYTVKCRVLDAQWLGVPQARQRTIFIGVRDDLGIEPVYPEPLPYRYTIRDAFAAPMPITDEERAHKVDFAGYAIAPEWDKLRPGDSSERYFNLVRPDIDKPSPTILASGGTPGVAGVTHPTERRKFTIPELRRVCSFPDDFVLTGSYQQQWERLGRAVPPVMMSHIGAAVRDGILRKVRGNAG
jgi:DNA (cytosine-5)-methyltransferase 1